jgi:hypothetical protein
VGGRDSGKKPVGGGRLKKLTTALTQFLEGRAPSFHGCADDLSGFFQEFVLAHSFPSFEDRSQWPRRKRQAMLVLSGAVLQLQLKGAIGASSLTKWK